MKMNKKGFTLIEMLVVIAIIAVLVAIVIPVVGNATEKAKEAADAANIRAAIAEVTTVALMDGAEAANNLNKTVTMTQGVADFVTEELENIGGLTDTQFAAVEDAIKDKVIAFGWDGTNNKLTVTVDGTAVA